MLELNRETRVTFVLVTHDEELACHAHRRLRMKDGQFEDGSGLV
jgi:predicted ABC-type transport system involved in lysophospholipase L1 biosynthesis ATPase subunit